MYCKTNIDGNSVIDVCRRCGIGVWGSKMFNTIVENMEGAREAGDLYQGSVSDSQSQKTIKKSGLSCIAEEALAQQEAQQSPDIVEEQLEALEEAKPTKEDIPPLVEAFPEFAEAETLEPESEVKLEPPMHQQIQQKEQESEEAFFVDNY
ncbi:MAG: hypothetical protein KJ718_02680 [Nanoarchaeota archaeon]|nr:hypothetical protein [Nanoarchaeota archaeon]MBU1051435.1 hypothetical protein [Nanoarchaeota archaeon]